MSPINSLATPAQQFGAAKKVKVGPFTVTVDTEKSAEKLAGLGNTILDAALKAGIKKPEQVDAAVKAIQEVPVDQVLDSAAQLLKAKIGEDGFEAAKQVAGGNTELLEAGLQDVATRATNLGESVTQNLGEKAGTVFNNLAVTGLALLKKAAELAAAAPVLAPMAAEKAAELAGQVAAQGQAGLDAKAASLNEQAALALKLKELLPTAAGKATELAGKAAGAFKPNAELAKFLELSKKLNEGEELSEADKALFAEIMKKMVG
ncbi:MAG: hypothetical protein K2X66_02640 [Cyanobacteria bacterium]|nr:hypothetical protein [Cyanobacteriota bacterium]